MESKRRLIDGVFEVAKATKTSEKISKELDVLKGKLNSLTKTVKELTERTSNPQEEQNQQEPQLTDRVTPQPTVNSGSQSQSDVPIVEDIPLENQVVNQQFSFLPNFYIEYTDEFEPGTPLYIGGNILCNNLELFKQDQNHYWNTDLSVDLVTGVSCWTVNLAIEKEIAQCFNLSISYKYSGPERPNWERSDQGSKGNRLLDCSKCHITTLKYGELQREFYLVHITLLPLKG